MKTLHFLESEDFSESMSSHSKPQSQPTTTATRLNRCMRREQHDDKVACMADSWTDLAIESYVSGSYFSSE